MLRTTLILKHWTPYSISECPLLDLNLSSGLHTVSLTAKYPLSMKEAFILKHRPQPEAVDSIPYL